MSAGNAIPFQFRQRAGRLNWKQISTVDMKDMVNNVNINELQQLLDTVTFSEVNREDIKTNSAENINTLIQLLQYIVEYLLNHQENQFALVLKLNNKINKLKQSREKYFHENLSFREDIKTYQRQLHILRKGIHQQDPLITFGVRQPSQPKWHNHDVAEEKSSNANNSGEQSEAIVRSILDHERESRRTMVELLDEQRRQFSRDMTTIVDTLQRHTPVPATVITPAPQQLNTDMIVQNLQLQLDKMMKAALDSHSKLMQEQQQQQSKLLQLSHPSTTQSETPKPSTQEILRQAALEELEKQLKERSKELREKEESLLEREAQLARKESTRRSFDLASKFHNSSVKDQAAKRVIGCRFFRSIIQGALRRTMNIAFRQWFSVVLDEKDKERLEKHGRMLLYANEKKDVHQQELQAELAQQEIRNADIQSRLLSTMGELLAVQELNSELKAQNNKTMQLNEQLKDQLQEEKEKCIVMTAKYNTLNHMLERESSSTAIAQTVNRPPSPLRSPERKKPSASLALLLGSLRSELLRPDLNEDDLLRVAESRVEQQNSASQMHDIAKRQLAKDIMLNLSDKVEADARMK